MALSFVTALRNSRLDEITALVDADVGAGTLRVLSGSAPASANAAETGTLLAEITLNDPFAAAASSGVLTLNGTPLSDSSADNTGTAGYFRIVDNTGDVVLQGSVGTSGADMNFDTLSITAAQTVTLTSGTITEGNA